MLEDDKLEVDEVHRVRLHQDVKGEAIKETRAEIADQMHRKNGGQQKDAAVIGEHLREKALGEIVSTEAEIERGRAAARVSQIVDYVFSVTYALIGLEILLEMLGARDSNAFKRLIDTITAPFLAPFNALIPDLTSGRFSLKLSYLIALLVYALLHLAINGLLRRVAHRKVQI